MKVLLVNKYWYPRGGAEVVALMTKNLLEQNGHDVAVFGMQHSQNLFQHDFFPPEIDYRKDSFSKKVKNSLKTIHNGDAKKQFEKMIVEFWPDVIHFHNIYHQLSFSLLEVAKQYNIRTVMTLHDYKLLSPNYSLYHHGKIDRSILGKKYYRCLLSNCLESVPESLIGTLEAYYRHYKKYHSLIDVYVSPSHFLKDLFVESGWNKNKIEIVRNPVVVPSITKHQGGGSYVAFIGRLSSEKGVDVLLHAAEMTPQIPYVIVGTGEMETSLRSWALHKNLKNVLFVGYKTGKELDDLYTNARLLVVPSLWYENYPLGILEAKAHAKVVLASDVGGIPEMLSKEFLFPMGDHKKLAHKIQKWFNSEPYERKQIGLEFQKQVVLQNDPTDYVKRLRELYRFH